MDSHKILSLLGLALRGGHLTVGEEPVEAVVRARDARLLLVASDATDNTFRRVRHFADAGACLWLKLPCTKDELGSAVGRTSVAMVALTDIGLASAVARRLEELDPKRYSEAAQRLDVKAKRAAERRAEQQAHEKNVRTGKAKAKKEAAKAAAAKAEAPAQQQSGSGRKAPVAVRSKAADGKGKTYGSRPSRDNRPKARAKTDRYAHSRPVKKGKGSFRKKED